ncbi:Solute carrier family 35 member G1 [Holothuria leucospilota]|uniref:Solute carrier family 35 member G1 n=1 Tax=Holothuria leucospilota TaxID=206669 RepID=A0A9Q1BAX3_HOLLE|nr:Solute carrier family 35 member G1 [Holothuria leucospilota]
MESEIGIEEHRNGVLHTLCQHKGLFIAFVASCFYATQSFSVSLLQGALPLGELIFLRAVVILMGSIVCLIYLGNPVFSYSRREIFSVLVYSLLGLTSTITLFYAYQNMRAGDAAAIYYGNVAFTGLFARLILKEAFGFVELILVAMTLVGMCLIARPPFLFTAVDDYNTNDITGSQVIPALMAFVSCISLALSVVIVRAVTKDKAMHPFKVTFFYSALSIIVFTVALPTPLMQQWIVPDCAGPRFLILLMTTSSFLGYGLFTFAFSIENALYISLVTMNELFIICILDIAILGLNVQYLSVIGILLIFGSSMLISIKKIIAFKRQKRTSERQNSEMQPVATTTAIMQDGGQRKSSQDE